MFYRNVTSVEIVVEDSIFQDIFLGTSIVCSELD
jgi:hypothetical protein